MHFAFTEEQEELRAAARAFLADQSGSEPVRAAMTSELGHDPALWKRIAAELGWPSVIVPEAYGGIGLGWVELVALLEASGETLLCAPFFSTVCLGINALLVAGSESQKQRYLPALADGNETATLAHAEAEGGWDLDAVATLARVEGDEIVLSGAKRYVVDGHCADWLIVSARSADSCGAEGLSLFVVPGSAAGLERAALPTLDATRRLAQVTLRDVRVPLEARLGEEGAAAPELRKILDLAAVGLAAEQVGGAQRCLDMSVTYAKERVQFGRPIGGFQAIKHKCADVMVAVEAGRSASYYAACVAAEGGADLARAASTAKATCSQAFFRAAADAIQIHGGVGFTWEYDVHLYFKRARAGEGLLGDPAWHRERVAREIGL